MNRESVAFKTEVNQLLDLMIHSLYSHKEIFLRELVSNASDAIDKLRYEALTKPDLLKESPEFRIKLVPNKGDSTLSIIDNGIGMTREDAIRELGTIARSGTKEFIETLKRKQSAENNPELIGQFGVGFYSAFMVADRVTVISKIAGQPDTPAVRWESRADGTFTIEDTEKDSHGTTVILHLKDDQKEYLEEWSLRQVVRKYSDYIEHPIVMDVERQKQDPADPDNKEKRITVREEETLNSRKAIWLRKKAEVTDDEYHEFYKHISHDYTEPAATIHYRAEGSSEFAALLFIPKRAPFNIQYREYEVGPMLYVRRVQIMNNCEQIIPPYLRFVKGVVDSSDLPLNVSREMLQNNREIELINKSVTKKVLDTLREMKDNRYDEYVEFYKQLGRVLKEGIHFDFERRETVASLLLFDSTQNESGKFTTLDAYVDRMKPEQKEIYYITSTSRDEALSSPYLESFKKNGFDVLILTDDVDDIIMSSLPEYKEKPLKSVLKGDVEVDESAKDKRQEDQKKFSALIDLIKDRLKDKVADVRLSGRLTDSPCCLVAPEGGMDHNVEAMLKAMGQSVSESKRILEINPDHAVLKSMEEMFESDKESPRLKEYVDLLYEQARVLMGVKPENPAAFIRLVNKLMTGTKD